MHEERKRNVYGKFEVGAVSGAAHPFVKSDYRKADPATDVTTTRVVPTKNQALTNKWIVFALSASSSFITTLDGSIVNIGLPAISRTFNVGVSGPIEWIIIGYLVIIASVLLTFGRLADMIGRKPILLMGLTIFVLGSALCGMAPSLWLLI